MSECGYEECSEPALQNSEFCIFHKPDKNEEEARVFYKRIRQEAREPDGEIVEDENGKEHRRWVFEKKEDWTGYRFPKYPQNAKISIKSTPFTWANFKAPVNFSRVNFEGDINFRDTMFEDQVRFEKSYFKGSSCFEGVHFSKSVTFRDSYFRSHSSFWNAFFEEETTFEDADFKGSTSFEDSYFGGKVNFWYATFWKEIYFVNAVFGGSCSFIKAVFLHDLRLSSTDFERPPDFIFDLKELDEGVDFGKINATYSIISLQKTNLPIKEIIIRHHDAPNELYTNKKRAIQRIQELKKSDEKISTKILVDKFSRPETKVEGCREQRLTYEARGKKEEADQVFVHEMRARRETKDSRFQQFIDWFVADWTCRYGTSWQRVFGVSAISIFFFALMYWGKKISVLTAEEGFGYIFAENTAEIFGRALHRSVMIFTTLGYTPEYFDDYPMLQVLSGAESIFGALAVALIIVVFARKWMRG